MNRNENTPQEPLPPIRGEAPPPGFKSGIEWFNPERAELHIKKDSKYQRPVSKAYVKKYARDMRNGKWTFNASPVRFDGVDDHGQPRMIDGFHRMEALLLANATMPFLVTYGIGMESMRTMDTGRSRSLQQMFALDGVSVASVVAPAIVYLAAFLKNGSFSAEKSSNSEYFDVLYEHSDIKQIATKYDVLMPRNLPKGLVTCCHYLFAKKDPELAEYVCEAVVSGAGLERNAPAYIFREWVNAEGENFTTGQIANALVDCWNKEVRGEKMTRIRLQKRCPVILGPESD
jgi:hypothetical protein